MSVQRYPNALVDDTTIARVVHSFYDRVRRDDLLAPVFERAVGDWPTHLRRMCDFWSSVLQMSGRYHGQPMAIHRALPIDGRHFDRWLALFAETVRVECAPETARIFVDRSTRIAASLQSAGAVS